MNDMQNDPVYMNPQRKQARDQALFQQRMTGRPQYVLLVNARHPGAGFEFTDRLEAGDALRLTDHITIEGEVIDLTPLRGIDR